MSYKEEDQRPSYEEMTVIDVNAHIYPDLVDLEGVADTLRLQLLCCVYLV